MAKRREYAMRLLLWRLRQVQGRERILGRELRGLPLKQWLGRPTGGWWVAFLSLVLFLVCGVVQWLFISILGGIASKLSFYVDVCFSRIELLVEDYCLALCEHEMPQIKPECSSILLYSGCLERWGQLHYQYSCSATALKSCPTHSNITTTRHKAWYSYSLMVILGQVGNKPIAILLLWFLLYPHAMASTRSGCGCDEHHTPWRKHYVFISHAKGTGLFDRMQFVLVMGFHF